MRPSPLSADFMCIVSTTCRRQSSANTRRSCEMQMEILLLLNRRKLEFWQLLAVQPWFPGSRA